MTQASNLRILIADDHDLIRDMFAGLMRELSENTEIFHAGSLPQALELAKNTGSLNLIVLDLRMPGMNELAGLRAMQDISGDTPVLIMSGETDQELIRAALQLGAAGFVPKTMRAATMLNALRLVLSGGRYIPDQAFQTDEPKTGPTANLELLTARELEILKHLVKGLSNKEIGRELSLAEVTVGLRLRSIYRKIGVKTRTQAVRLAIRHGMDS